jgi:AcrR family transcriptional regulator
MSMPDDLRDRLVAAGVELVARDGVDGLGLREIARYTGVSHGAPRRYFPTHRDLLAAIALRGYRSLGARITGIDPAAGPRDRVLELGRRYLEFAAGERGMFDLMFRHDLLRGNGIGLREASLELFAVLVDLVREALPDGPEPSVVAGALWANLHGIAQLRQWGSLEVPAGTDDPEPFLVAAVDAHLGRR